MFQDNSISNLNDSIISSTSTASKDKKPRARETTELKNDAADATSHIYNLDHNNVIGTNPFLATTREERLANFPPFESAFYEDFIDHDYINNPRSGWSNNNADDGTTNSDGHRTVDLSISARAALAEHNRHVSRYGIDNSLIYDDADDDTFPSSFPDPLDVEWERLLLNSSNNSVVNISHISSHQSDPSISAKYPTFEEKVRITSIQSPDGAENEAIEVMTEISCSDFLNTSQPINVLRTPEHVKRQQRDDAAGVTVRGKDVLSTSYQTTSEASFSDDSTRKLQKLYMNSMLPPLSPSHRRVQNDSSSMTLTPPPNVNTKSMDNDGYHPQSSYSLHNVDLSRISADDDDDSAVRNLDHSFLSTNNNNQNMLPDHTDHFDIGINLNYDQTPSTSNSKSRKTIKQQQQTKFDETSKQPTSLNDHLMDYTGRLNDFTKLSKEEAALDNNDNSKLSSPNRFRYSNPKHLKSEEEKLDECDEPKLEMMGLSPISRQAADTAISLLQSSPDWNIPKKALTDANPFRPEPLPELLHGINSSENQSQSCDSIQNSNNIIEYENQSRSTSGEQQLRLSYEFGISPLNSSSEQNNNTNTSGNSTIQNNSGLESSPNVFENSSGSDENLKKNSLSSISPNSSSEHHVTTKPTATTNSSSSYSATSHSDAQKSEKRQGQQTTALHNVKNQSLPTWDDLNDRRRYRTVVPIRVFMNEPRHFPNEDDSFTKLRCTKNLLSNSSVSSLPTGMSKNVRHSTTHQLYDRSERSIRSAPR